MNKHEELNRIMVSVNVETRVLRECCGDREHMTDQQLRAARGALALLADNLDKYDQLLKG